MKRRYRAWKRTSIPSCRQIPVLTNSWRLFAISGEGLLGTKKRGSIRSPFFISGKRLFLLFANRVPIDVSGCVHEERENQKDSEAAQEKGVIFRRKDYVNERVEKRKNRGDGKCERFRFEGDGNVCRDESYDHQGGSEIRDFESEVFR